MSTVVLEYMTCRCGRGCISVRATDERGGTRITDHKCTGEWTPMRAYMVDAEKLVEAVKAASARVEGERP